MEWETIEPLIPIVISFGIGLAGGWYVRFKKIVTALSKAMDDDKITAEELRVVNDAIRGR